MQIASMLIIRKYLKSHHLPMHAKHLKLEQTCLPNVDAFPKGHQQAIIAYMHKLSDYSAVLERRMVPQIGMIIIN
jgi:hypothetical protein